MISRFKYEILIFLFAVLIRLPFLGYDSFNTDVWKWKARTYNFSNGVFGLKFEETLQRYHPGVSLMWLGTVAIKVYNLHYDFVYGTEPATDRISVVFGLNFVQKYFVVLAISFAIACAFYVMRYLFTLKYAVLATLFLLFEPFYSALAREYHLEGLLSTFMIASVLLWYNFIATKLNLKYSLVFSAFFASLAVLTKISSLIIIPFAFVSYFVVDYLTSHQMKNTLKVVFVNFSKWLGLVVFFIFVLWPALWVRPVDVLNQLYRGIFSVGVEGGHEQFYFNKYVMDPGFTFYFVAIFLRSSVFLLPGLLGYFLFVHRKMDSRFKQFAIYMLVFAVLYLIPMLLSSKKLDRYMLPTLMSLSLVSSAFYYYLVDKFKIAKYAVGTAMLVWVLYFALITPDYFSYYSPYGGGLKKGIFIIEPKWVIGAKDIQAFLTTNIEQNKKGVFIEYAPFRRIKRTKELMQDKVVVAMPEKYFTQLYPFIQQVGSWAVIDKLYDDARHANYFIYPVWEDTSSNVTKHNLKYYDSIYTQGVKTFNVYERID